MIRGFLSGEPRFLSADEVLTLHETCIDAFGGSLGVRDAGLLDSALATPRQAFGGQFVHEFPFGMAAAYLFHLCANHPFIDGNKRVALAACVAFLRMNGWNLVATDDGTVELVSDVARSTKSTEDVTDWLVENVRERTSLELRDFFQRLDYASLAQTFSGITAGQTAERVATIIEAGTAIPAISQANIGALAAEEAGDIETAQILHQHGMLLTAIYRIAEGTGYEW